MSSEKLTPEQFYERFGSRLFTVEGKKHSSSIYYKVAKRGRGYCLSHMNENGSVIRDRGFKNGFKFDMDLITFDESWWLDELEDFLKETP